MEKYIEALKDISYYDWIRLKNGMDQEFDRKIGESKKNLKLTDPENVKKSSTHNLEVDKKCGSEEKEWKNWNEE